ncbi:MAG: molecular chaperone DnaK, partial [Thermoplasmata archaeon]|nr:molecular chaperone DnaK [Thermoplasmata archaeon]
LDKLRETLKEGTTQQIKDDMESLGKVMHEVTTALYQQVAQEQAAQEQAQGSQENGAGPAGEGDYVDADFKEVDD